jgi:hypothetical protein
MLKGSFWNAVVRRLRNYGSKFKGGRDNQERSWNRGTKTMEQPNVTSIQVNVIGNCMLNRLAAVKAYVKKHPMQLRPAVVASSTKRLPCFAYSGV